MKRLFKTETQDFFMPTDRERNRFKKDISLKIYVDNEEISLYRFNVIWRANKVFFSYKEKKDEVGNKIVLYLFTEETNAEYLTKFFEVCRKNKIIPIDIVVKVKEALQQQKSLARARELMTKRKKK